MENKIKLNLKQEIISILIVIVSLFFSFYFYKNFPEIVPSHWNFAGEVDNWTSKFIGAFLLPVILIFMYVMFLFLPKIDPKKERYLQFWKPYKIFQTLIMLFLLIIYLLTSFYALGYELNMSFLIPLLVGLLFIALGNYFGKLKRNWFVGIKTPWTLSSETAWNKTHRLAGKIFVLGGVILAIISLLPVNIRLYVFIFDILMIIFVPIFYSFFISEKK